MSYSHEYLVIGYLFYLPAGSLEVKIMPVKYRCRHCGYILYEFKGVGQSYIGVPTPSEVIKLIGHVCPYCKRVLEIPRGSFKDYIVVKPTAQRVTGEVIRPVEISRGVENVIAR